MRHAVLRLAFAALAGLALSPSGAWAQKPAGLMNAIGLVDFGHRPDFKVGSFATYHVQATSALGVVDDYTMTVLIAGEEHWWGEDCFWIETITTTPRGSNSSIASLMSYEVFKDSLGLQNMQLYVRKVINGVTENGAPLQEVYKRPASTLKAREPAKQTFRLLIDTLGTETIQTAKGEFACTKMQMTQGRSQTGAGSLGRDPHHAVEGPRADSSDYLELREIRTSFMTPRVPITHIAREDILQKLSRRAWKIGKSSDATPLVTLDETNGSATLVDFGDNGKSQILPPSMQKSLAQLAAEKRTTAPPRVPPKPRTGARKSG
jgi:hypothetical protein